MRLRTESTATIAALLLLVGVAWAFSVQRMTGMDMGMSSSLGSLPFFVVTWTAMMAAMMLPSALPAALGLDGLAPLGFAASYVAVLGLVGMAAFAAYRGIRVADGSLVIAAAVYELTPLKRRCLARCRDGALRNL